MAISSSYWLQLIELPMKTAFLMPFTFNSSYLWHRTIWVAWRGSIASACTNFTSKHLDFKILSDSRERDYRLLIADMLAYGMLIHPMMRQIGQLIMIPLLEELVSWVAKILAHILWSLSVYFCKRGNDFGNIISRLPLSTQDCFLSFAAFMNK